MPFLRTIIGLPAENKVGVEVRTKAGQRIKAATLGEAVAQAERILGVKIVPHDPPKWFRVYVDASNYRLVDIHVHRSGQNICPKQDLAFPLIDSDVVAIGALAC